MDLVGKDAADREDAFGTMRGEAEGAACGEPQNFMLGGKGGGCIAHALDLFVPDNMGAHAVAGEGNCLAKGFLNVPATEAYESACGLGDAVCIVEPPDERAFIVEDGSACSVGIGDAIGWIGKDEVNGLGWHGAKNVEAVGMVENEGVEVDRVAICNRCWIRDIGRGVQCCAWSMFENWVSHEFVLLLGKVSRFRAMSQGFCFAFVSYS